MNYRNKPEGFVTTNENKQDRNNMEQLWNNLLEVNFLTFIFLTLNLY